MAATVRRFRGAERSRQLPQANDGRPTHVVMEARVCVALSACLSAPERRTEALPLLVAVEREEGTYDFCVGTAISASLVVTAAHCVADIDRRRIVVTLQSGLSEEVLAKAIHPRFNRSSGQFDLAVLSVGPGSLKSDAAIGPLPEPPADLYSLSILDESGLDLRFGEGASLRRVDWNDGGDVCEQVEEYCVRPSSRSGLCAGDSGAALVGSRPDEDIVVGFFSHVLGGDDSDPCSAGVAVFASACLVTEIAAVECDSRTRDPGVEPERIRTTVTRGDGP